MKAFSFLLIVMLISLLVLGCGGDSKQDSDDSGAFSDDKATSNFEHVKLTEDQMDHYVKVHQKFVEVSKEVVEEHEQYENKDDFMTALKAMKMGRKYGKQYQKILKSEGFSEKEFGNVHGTITEIWGILWQQKIFASIGGGKGIGGLADHSITMMESMLNNPNIDDETKENLEKQIEEAKSSREEFKKEHQKQQQVLENLDPENVALVKKYMPELMQGWGLKGDLPL